MNIKMRCRKVLLGQTYDSVENSLGINNFLSIRSFLSLRIVDTGGTPC
jgi:hypothetical protein